MKIEKTHKETLPSKTQLFCVCCAESWSGYTPMHLSSEWGLSTWQGLPCSSRLTVKTHPVSPLAADDPTTRLLNHLSSAALFPNLISHCTVPVKGYTDIHIFCPALTCVNQSLPLNDIFKPYHLCDCLLCHARHSSLEFRCLLVNSFSTQEISDVTLWSLLKLFVHTFPFIIHPIISIMKLILRQLIL